MSEAGAEAIAASVRALSSEAARAALIDSARKIAARNGIDQVKLGPVADEAGIPRATAYGCFSNRLELLQSVVADDLGALASILRRARGLPETGKTPPPPPTRVERYELPETSVRAGDENRPELTRDVVEDRLWSPTNNGLSAQASVIEHLERSIATIENGFQEQFERRVAALEERIAAVDARTEREKSDSAAALSSLRMEASGLNVRTSTAEKVQQEVLLRLTAQVEALEKMVQDHARADEPDEFLTREFANDASPPETEHTQTVETQTAREVPTEDFSETLLLEAKDMLPPEHDTMEVAPIAEAMPEHSAPEAATQDETLPAEAHGEAPAREEPSVVAALAPEPPRRMQDYISAARRAAMSSVANDFADPAGTHEEKTRNRLMIAGTAVLALLLVGATISLRQAASHSTQAAASQASTSADGVAHMRRHVASAAGALTPLDRTAQEARAGNAEAELAVGLKYLSGDGIPKDETEALKWISQAAQKGNPAAEGWMGTLYAHGRGVRQDPAEAFVWFEKAAQQGDRKAMHDLANAYAEGSGVAVNYFEAARWFSRAANLGYVDSAFNLAVLYERGDGVPQSLLDAYKWYAIAAGEGDQESKTRMTAIASELSPDGLAAAQNAATAFRAQTQAQALPKT